jgi:hypothetical protein
LNDITSFFVPLSYFGGEKSKNEKLMQVQKKNQRTRDEGRSGRKIGIQKDLKKLDGGTSISSVSSHRSV